MKADLHLHSTASDGELAPGELVARAAQMGFDVIALTDHDSVDGVCQAQRAGRELGVEVLAGVELSCGSNKEIHILGYGFDPKNAALLDFCAARRAQREARAEQMAARLCEMGKEISLERVRALARGVIGRPHIAKALLEAGHVKSVSEAFDRFLAPGKPGYVPREHVKVGDALRLIGAAGGVAVLAHPLEMRLGEMAMEALVCEWKAQGLAGLEVYHPSAANNHAAFLLALAGRENLLVTGGSDFHGCTAHRGDIGEGLDRWRSAHRDVHALRREIARRQASGR